MTYNPGPTDTQRQPSAPSDVAPTAPPMVFTAGATDQHHSRVVSAPLGHGAFPLVRIAVARWGDGISLEWVTDPRNWRRFVFSAAQARSVAAELLASAEESEHQAQGHEELNAALAPALAAWLDEQAREEAELSAALMAALMPELDAECEAMQHNPTPDSTHTGGTA